MKRLLILLCILPITGLAQTPLTLNWDVSGVTNCDADGSLLISNGGNTVTVLQMEGPNCEPCTTPIQSSCVASSGVCSNQPNVITAIIEVGSFNQVSLDISISPTSTTHEHDCSVADFGLVSAESILSGNLIFGIGQPGLNTIATHSSVYDVQSCDEILAFIIITNSNSASDNEGFIFDFDISGIGSNSQIPSLFDLDIDFPILGCPGTFTEISISNCPTCTQISASPLNGGPTITSIGSSIQIPIPYTQSVPLQYDITYTDGTCSITFPIDVPFLDSSIFTNSDFFPDPFCPGFQTNLITTINLGSIDITGNWSGPGVLNNVFTDPGLGANTYQLTFTSTTCNIQFDQSITIGSSNYAGPNRLTGTNQGVDYVADGIIESIQTIAAPFSVDYNSGTEIELLPSFEVESNARFHAFIQGCL